MIDANGNIKNLALYNAFSGNGTIYAYWIPQNQTYSFDANGGSGGPNTVTVMYGSKLPSINKFPTKTGYTFAGYYTAASGGTQYYGANGVSSITNSASGGTTPLYAHWTANKYNVTFNTNGGTNSTVQSVTYDSTLPTGVIAPSKTGYKFEGYYLDKACTTSKYYNENMNVALSPNKWTIAADTTLYAKWTPIKYNIMLMSDDDVHGSGGSGFVDLLTNVEYGKLELPRAEDKNMSREHYDFVGWNIYDGQDWAMYQPMQTYSTGLTGVAGETVPVYAAWKVKDSYTVAYSSNGGTGAPRSQLVFDTEETWNLEVADETANDLKYPNYSFLGWSVNPSGGFETELNNGYAEPFKKGDKIKVNSSMTLYARWEKNKALAYNANGGILPSVIETTYPAKGSKVPVVLEADRVPTRTGYIFKGWSENPEDTPGNAYFGSNNQYTMTGEKDVTLYAVWDKEQYDVLYNYYYNAETNQDVKDTEKENELAAAGIEIINNDSSVKYMEDCSFTLKYDDRATNVKNLSVKINNIDAFSPAKSENGHEVTLKYTIPKATAKQYVSIEGASRITYGITYVNNGGQVDSLETDPLVSNYEYASSENINLIGAPTYNESGVLTKTGIFKTGYVFDGWYTESSFENKVESISKSEAKDVVLYAKWSPIQYSIVYDANSSLVTGNVPESQTGIYDSSVVIQDTGTMLCQRNSKVFPFIGWSTNPQATVADYSEGETVQNLSDINGGVIKLYAVWEIKNYKVSYDVNGGTGNVPTVIKSEGEVIDVDFTSNISRSGFDFVGWQEEGTLYTKDGTKQIPDIDKDHKLVAQWKEKEYEVKYVIDPGNYIDESAPEEWKNSLTLSFNGISVDAKKDEKIISGIKLSEAHTVLELVSNDPGVTTDKYTATINNEMMEFLGWKMGDTFYQKDELIYGSLNSSGNAQNVVLEAVFKNGEPPAIPKYLFYNLNGGSWNGKPENPGKTDEGNTIPITTTTPVKTGYSFAGWEITEGNVLHGGALVDVTGGNKTAIAKWEPVSYKVYYDFNDYTGDLSAKFRVYEDPDTHVKSSIYDPGVKGVSWTGNTVNAIINGNTIGSVTLPSSEHTYNESKAIKTVASLTYKSDNYDFKGWSLIKNATVAEFVDGENVINLPYSQLSDGSGMGVTLYAVWEKKTPLVRYNANGGSGEPAPVYASVGSTVYIGKAASGDTITDVPTREGYNFLGWSTDSRAAAPIYQVIKNTDDTYSYTPDSFAPAGKTILYAIWQKRVIYHVEYTAAEGTNGMVPVDSNNYYDNDTYSIDFTAIPERVGYSFQGWEHKGNVYSTESEINTITINESMVDSSDEDYQYIKFTQIMEPNTYKVRFYNSATQIGSDIDATYNVIVDYSSISVTPPTGYTFAGWSGNDGGAVNYEDGAQLKNLTSKQGEVVSLYAVFEPVSIKITFIDEDNRSLGGDLKSFDKTGIAYNAMLPTLTTTPTQKGAEFIGYYDAAEGGTQYYDKELTPKYNGGINNKVEDITLYAHWEAITYRIVYYDGDEVVKTVPVKYGSSFTINDESILKTGTIVEDVNVLKAWSTTGKDN